LSYEELYKCDETGLYFKMLPSKTGFEQRKLASGLKPSKGRVTIIACCNASTNHKIKLDFIGRKKTKHILPPKI
jgi:hypothetical protein